VIDFEFDGSPVKQISFLEPVARCPPRLYTASIRQFKVNTMKIKALLIESIRSGTIAALVIVPLSPLFKAAGLRIGHYGPKFASLFFDDPQPWLLFVQHLVVGWISALPLLVILARTGAGTRPILASAVYGAAYYVAVNSLGLPLYFGDSLPWQLGAATVLPSLFGHIIYGTSIGLTSRRFLTTVRSDKHPS
jgi:uncharacterized membrane protein YagU involved in acid resistance